MYSSAIYDATVSAPATSAAVSALAHVSDSFYVHERLHAVQWLYSKYYAYVDADSLYAVVLIDCQRSYTTQACSRKVSCV
jgi:hypothetical protein